MYGGDPSHKGIRSHTPGVPHYPDIGIATVGVWASSSANHEGLICTVLLTRTVHCVI
jgi:hypothetical protein